MPAESPEGLCPECLGRVALGATTVSGVATENNLYEGDLALGQNGKAESGSCFGDYELLEKVASGGMGVVYRARQVSLDRVVALKMILAPKLSDPECLRRFQTEAEATARLHHPNIVALHDFGQLQGQHFYTMDFVEGRSLAEVLREHTLPPSQAAGYVKSIAQAIHYAHQRGILHRDLKPSNVLVDQDDQPRITDFGLAKLMQGESDLTLTGQVVGSPSYMAPEQAEGRAQDVSVRSDVYALGAMLYEMVTGRPPFKAESVVATLKQVLENTPISPRDVNPKLPQDIATICLKCLEKDPARRYGSAQALADDLNRFLRDEPVLARPVGGSERLWRWCRRNPKLAGAVAVAIVAVASGVGGVTWQWREAEASRLRAESEGQRTRRHLYAADMHAAQQAFEGQQWGLAKRLLQAHRPLPGQEDLRGFEWHYLWGQMRGDHLFALPGHSNVVTALAFSPDGRLLVSAGREGCLRVWDIDRRTLLRVLPCAARHVYGVSFSSLGTEMAIGTSDGVQLWSTDPWQITDQIAARAASVAFAPSNSLLAIGQNNVPWGTDQSGPTVLWDTARREAVLTLTNAGGRVAFAPDGRTLATGNWKDEINLWEMPAGTRRHTLTNGLRLLGLEFSPDGRFLAGLEWFAGPRLWSVPDWAPLGVLPSQGHRVRALAFSPDSRILATAGSDQTVSLWETESRRLLYRLRGHGDEIWSLAFSPNGKLLASGGRDDAVFVWNPSTISPSNCLSGLVERLGTPTFALSQDGLRIAALTDKGIAVWDTASLQLLVPPLSADPPLAFGSSNNELIALSSPAALLKWDLVTRQPVASVQLPSAFSHDSDCRLSRSGRWIGFADHQGLLYLAETRTGRSPSKPKPHYRYVLALDFSRDESLLVSSDLSGHAFLWEVPTLRQLGVFRGHKDYIRGLAISPDGSRVATASADGTARLWSVPDCKELALLRGHNEDVIDAAFSPDGRTLATSSYDRTVRLWHLSTFREIMVLPHPDRVLRVQFSGDGRCLATMGQDRAIRFWRAPIIEETQTTGAKIP